MHGKIIQFSSEIANFKVKDGIVTVQLSADTKDIPLDKLNEIAQGPIRVNLEASQTELVPEQEDANN